MTDVPRLAAHGPQACEDGSDWFVWTCGCRSVSHGEGHQMTTMCSPSCPVVQIRFGFYPPGTREWHGESLADRR